MLAGHFGLAAIVKTMEPKVPLWVLMASTQLLDIAFIPLLLTGSESIDKIGDGGYGEAVIHADYTHSLTGALLIAVAAALISWRIWNKRSAAVIGSLVFSHWLIDLLVHRSDMPLLPGNLGGFPLLGFGLWELPAISAILELSLVLTGAGLYLWSIKKRTAKQKYAGSTASKPTVRTYGAGWIMAVFLILTFAADYFSL
ncbi:permease [Paenibacillus sp. FSL K6-3182]|uniref:permease n=1 Tax=Paenibacillus sp. FSL K6-3182 TaxID=2921495 RepID=UPI0030D24226